MNSKTQGNEVEEVVTCTSTTPNTAELDNSEFCDNEMNESEHDKMYDNKENEHITDKKDSKFQASNDIEFVVEEHIESRHVITAFESSSVVCDEGFADVTTKETSQTTHFERFTKPTTLPSFGLLVMPEISVQGASPMVLSPTEEQANLEKTFDNVEQVSIGDGVDMSMVAAGLASVQQADETEEQDEFNSDDVIENQYFQERDLAHQELIEVNQQEKFSQSPFTQQSYSGKDDIDNEQTDNIEDEIQDEPEEIDDHMDENESQPDNYEKQDDEFKAQSEDKLLISNETQNRAEDVEELEDDIDLANKRSVRIEEHAEESEYPADGEEEQVKFSEVSSLKHQDSVEYETVHQQVLTEQEDLGHLIDETVIAYSQSSDIDAQETIFKHVQQPKESGAAIAEEIEQDQIMKGQTDETEELVKLNEFNVFTDRDPVDDQTFYQEVQEDDELGNLIDETVLAYTQSVEADTSEDILNRVTVTSKAINEQSEEFEKRPESIRNRGGEMEEDREDIKHICQQFQEIESVLARRFQEKDLVEEIKEQGTFNENDAYKPHNQQSEELVLQSDTTETESREIEEKHQANESGAFMNSKCVEEEVIEQQVNESDELGNLIDAAVLPYTQQGAENINEDMFNYEHIVGVEEIEEKADSIEGVEERAKDIEDINEQAEKQDKEIEYVNEQAAEDGEDQEQAEEMHAEEIKDVEEQVKEIQDVEEQVEEKHDVEEQVEEIQDDEEQVEEKHDVEEQVEETQDVEEQVEETQDVEEQVEEKQDLEEQFEEINDVEEQGEDSHDAIQQGESHFVEASAKEDMLEHVDIATTNQQYEQLNEDSEEIIEEREEEAAHNEEDATMHADFTRDDGDQQQDKEDEAVKNQDVENEELANIIDAAVLTYSVDVDMEETTFKLVHASSVETAEQQPEETEESIEAIEDVTEEIEEQEECNEGSYSIDDEVAKQQLKENQELGNLIDKRVCSYVESVDVGDEKEIFKLVQTAEYSEKQSLEIEEQAQDIDEAVDSAEVEQTPIEEEEEEEEDNFSAEQNPVQEQIEAKDARLSVICHLDDINDEHVDLEDYVKVERTYSETEDDDDGVEVRRISANDIHVSKKDYETSLGDTNQLSDTGLENPTDLEQAHLDDDDAEEDEADDLAQMDDTGIEDRPLSPTDYTLEDDADVKDDYKIIDKPDDGEMYGESSTTAQADAYSSVYRDAPTNIYESVYSDKPMSFSDEDRIPSPTNYTLMSDSIEVTPLLENAPIHDSAQAEYKTTSTALKQDANYNPTDIFHASDSTEILHTEYVYNQEGSANAADQTMPEDVFAIPEPTIPTRSEDFGKYLDKHYHPEMRTPDSDLSDRMSDRQLNTDDFASLPLSGETILILTELINT